MVAHPTSVGLTVRIDADATTVAPTDAPTRPLGPVTFLAPKIVLTPLLIASASLAGRRWGAIISGWLLALPLTSGPIAVFISLELGPAAGAQAAAGSLVGASAQVAFAVAYAGASDRFTWPACLALGSLAFAATAAVIPAATPSVLAVLTVVAVVAALAGPLTRSDRPDVALSPALTGPPGLRPGRWDIPARAVVATALVLAISGVAPLVGGHAAGILATFPVYVSVLTTFAHRLGGAAQARGVLRGLVLGLPGFVAFFLVVAATVEPLGIAAAFASALVGALALNLVVLLVTVRRSRPGSDAR
jgi:hypothetical protein